MPAPISYVVGLKKNARMVNPGESVSGWRRETYCIVILSLPPQFTTLLYAVRERIPAPIEKKLWREIGVLVVVHTH